MARCKDCIHEKVCLHRANIQTDTYAYMGFRYDIEKCEHFTADVVPKSEVERWRRNLEAVLEERAETKTEVAMEIFEEIEREINDALQSNYNVLPQIEESEALWNRVNGKIDALRGMRGFIEELKEKYTEDKT